MRFSHLPLPTLKPIAVAAASIALLPACSHAGSVTAIPYTSLRGVPPAQTSIDLYPCPRSADSLVVYVHGGAWIKGDKSNVHSMPTFFVSNNVCFASASYPTTFVEGKSLMDLQVTALSSLNTWLRSQAQQGSNVNAYKNISVIGHSAGAHLVALADKRFGWNPNVRNLFLLDSGSYDIESKYRQSSGRYRELMSQVLQLDRYSLDDQAVVFKRYSPASLPPLGRNSTSPLNIFLLTGQRPNVVNSALALKNSYNSFPGYKVKLFQLPWQHSDFPRKIGVDQAFSNKLLGQIQTTAP